MTEDLSTNDGPGFRPSRRTVLAAAAWTVPAVVVTQTVGTMVASASEPVVLNVPSSTACKIPGNSLGNLGYNFGYVYFAVIANNLNTPICILDNAAVNLTVDNVARTVVGIADASDGKCNVDPACGVTIAANSTKVVAFYANTSYNSNTATLCVSFQYSVGACPTGAPCPAGTTVTPPCSSKDTPPWTNGQASCFIPVVSGSGSGTTITYANASDKCVAPRDAR